MRKATLRDLARAKARALKREITALYYASRHPGLPIWPKLVIAVTLAYAASPVDLIPDFVPVLGYLDDLVILPALIALAIKLIPKKVMEEAREKAEREPPRLRDNWFFAVIFILVWVAALGAIGLAVGRLFLK